MRFEDSERLLRGIAGFFFAVGWHDRMPPGVSRQFTAGRFLRPNQSGSHVWDPIDLIDIESVYLQHPWRTTECYRASAATSCGYGRRNRMPR